MPYVLVSAGSGEDRARRLVEESYDVAIIDRVDDAEALRERLALRPERPTLVVLDGSPAESTTSPHTLADALSNALDPGLDDAELADSMRALVNARRLVGQPTVSPTRADPRPDIFVASSAPMRSLLEMVRRVARSDSSVLLRGETGSGKEKIASLLHRQSRRRDGPLVAINCAAIPRDLFESELFGHRRGAFTGASRDHRGVFEQARGGTLFLDEIGDLPLALQPKLLRALQEHQVRPLGSDAVVDVDVRLVTATNRNLKLEADAGNFRPDLYYRLGVVELSVPPLRERRDDVWPLAEAWLGHFGAWMGHTTLTLDPDLRPILEAYAWPGNVRELINVMERAALLAGSEIVGPEDLPPDFTSNPADFSARTGVDADDPPPSPRPPSGDDARIGLPSSWLERPWRAVREELLETGERTYLEGLLTATRGRITEAARRAGMSERALFEKMRRHGLRKERFRSGP